MAAQSRVQPTSGKSKKGVDLRKLGRPGWNLDADVVVVGCGGAGAIAAMAAHDSGASVLVLEKAPRYGGNTIMCGGYVLWPNSVERGTAHAYALSWGTTPVEVCRAWARTASKIGEWADEMGLKYRVRESAAEFRDLPGSSSVRNLLIAGGGREMFRILAAEVRRRRIQVLLRTRVTELVQDPSTLEVTGLIADRAGSRLKVEAHKAVVLCTGGFEFDEAMKANFLRCYPVRFWGWRYNTGDGIRLAQKVGAGLWHMSAVSAGLSAWFPEYPSSWRVFAPSPGYMVVDKHGNRYCDETTIYSFRHTFAYALSEFELKTTEYARIPSFMIFDETTKKSGPLCPDLGFGVTSIPRKLGGAPKWSRDNSAEVQREWILKGQTVSELASRLNAKDWGRMSGEVGEPVRVAVDPAVLAETIARYNAGCRSKKDPDFGRDPQTLIPLSTPPYYAIALWPGGPNTLGGPVRNERAQVLDPNGRPIPRLFSAGELGSIFGFLYPASGGNLSELIAFGQIAGKNAAAERPRESAASSGKKST